MLPVARALRAVNVLPWFRRWRRSGGIVAAGMYAVILTWRIVDGGRIDEIAVLLCLPIALVAITYGVRGGVVAGLAGAALVGAWGGADVVALSELAALLLLGTLLGHTVDRWSAAEADNRRLAAAAARHREAVELHDTVVQGLAAAKWALEAGQLDRGLHVVTDTLETAQQHVSELLRDAGLAPHATPIEPESVGSVAAGD